MEQTPEEYRKNPIFGTDFRKPVSQILEEIRNTLTLQRGVISDIIYGYPQHKERLDFIEGYFTTGLVALFRAVQEIEKLEERAAERKKLCEQQHAIFSDKDDLCKYCGKPLNPDF